MLSTKSGENMETLYKKLVEYSQADYYAFHMPGHKRNKEIMDCGLPYEIDITEIEGFDDLHHAKEILKEGQEEAAKLYHADQSFYLVNGSTVGLLSAIMGCTSKGDRILIARNCHKSVYHAILMNELNPVYAYPDFEEEKDVNGQVRLEEVKRNIEAYPDTKVVVITSPTYDGVVSDIEKIVSYLHSKKIPLIVDEAHGAHFGFHSYFPKRANDLGADLVIQSLHKTLPALTQCALLHVNGTLVNREKIQQYLRMLQTSSPSYVLMASMSVCIDFLEQSGDVMFQQYVELLEETRNCLQKLKCLTVVETEQFDRSKILISTKNTSLSGKELSEILLNKYHLQMELSAGTYVLAMTTLADTKEGMDRFVKALFEIDEQLRSDKEEEKRVKGNFSMPRLSQVYAPAQIQSMIQQKETQSLSFKDCEGKISTEYAYVYPPGIPIVVPGERISKEAAELLDLYETLNFSIEGLHVENKIEVLINE